jgi:hypothetical protein
MARPKTPLQCLEESLIEWPAIRRTIVAPAAVAWIDGVMRNLRTQIDGDRLIATIRGCRDGVYSETVERQFDEIRVRQSFRRTA